VLRYPGITMSAISTILAIEDEPAIVRFLRSTLESPSLRILEAATGQEGLQLSVSQKPDVILLDLGLLHREAMETLKGLRQWTSTPVIILSSHDQEKEQTAALEAGADDYLVKPFGIIELATRVGLALRHKETQADEVSVYENKGLRVDLYAHRVWVHNKVVRLSPTEFQFLAVLVRHAGRLVSQSQLMKAVWGQTRDVTLDALRVFVYQLRQKIEVNPDQPRYLKTEPGLGYRLESTRKIFLKKSAVGIPSVFSTQSVLH
jgi:two-component system KDP operon response regulator KdpE